jgi:hypothetical protein
MTADSTEKDLFPQGEIQKSLKFTQAQEFSPTKAA